MNERIDNTLNGITS
jgi:amino acid transporter